MSSAIFIFATSFAGFYATVVWTWFGWIRVQRRQPLLVFSNLIMAASSLVVGMTAFSAGMGWNELANELFQVFRLLLLPLVALPVSLHMRQLRGMKDLIELARETEVVSREGYESDKREHEANERERGS